LLVYNTLRDINLTPVQSTNNSSPKAVSKGILSFENDIVSMNLEELLELRKNLALQDG